MTPERLAKIKKIAEVYLTTDDPMIREHFVERLKSIISDEPCMTIKDFGDAADAFHYAAKMGMGGTRPDAIIGGIPYEYKIGTKWSMHDAKVETLTHEEMAMKLAEHKPVFDPASRIKDGKFMNVVISPKEWAVIETQLGRHIGAPEIKEIILGIFSGSYKVQKR